MEARVINAKMLFSLPIVMTIWSYKTPANKSYCLFSFHCLLTNYGLYAFESLKDTWLKLNILCEKHATKSPNWSFQTSNYSNILTSATTNRDAGTHLMRVFPAGSPIGRHIQYVLHQTASQSLFSAMMWVIGEVIVRMNSSVLRQGGFQP